MGKGYVLVEGQGEIGAVDNLITRLSADLGAPTVWAPAIRWKNLHLRTGIEKGAGFVRYKRDVDALLILRDEDDDCPAEHGPEIAGWLKELNLDFPSAAVLLHPEYEVLFLPCLARIAGKPLGTGPACRPGRLPAGLGTIGTPIGEELRRDHGMRVSSLAGGGGLRNSGRRCS